MFLLPLLGSQELAFQRGMYCHSTDLMRCYDLACAYTSVRICTSTDLAPEHMYIYLPHPVHKSSHNIVCQSYTVPCTSSARTVTRLLVKGIKTEDIFFALFDLNFMIVQLVRQKYIKYCFRKYIVKSPILTG